MKVLKITLLALVMVLFSACSDDSQVSKKTNISHKIVPDNPLGARVYETCAKCHGSDGKNRALGRSQPINGWEPQRVKDRLKSFVNGSYKGPMAGIMKDKSSALTQEEIDQVSLYISNL